MTEVDDRIAQILTALSKEDKLITELEIKRSQLYHKNCQLDKTIDQLKVEEEEARKELVVLEEKIKILNESKTHVQCMIESTKNHIISSELSINALTEKKVYLANLLVTEKARLEDIFNAQKEESKTILAALQHMANNAQIK